MCFIVIKREMCCLNGELLTEFYLRMGEGLEQLYIT